MTVTTEPSQKMLRLRARRPVAINVIFQKKDGRTRVDVTGATLKLTVAPARGAGTLFTATATLVDAALGMFRLDIQADDLNRKADTDYPFDLTLKPAGGYACSVLTGVISITPNPDTVVPTDYDPDDIEPSDTLMVTMLDAESFVVQLDHTPDLVLASMIEGVQLIKADVVAASEDAAASAAAAAYSAEVAVLAAEEAGGGGGGGGGTVFDTGFRDVSAWFPGWTFPAGGEPTIRRRGDTVWLDFDKATATGFVLLTFPLGFRPFRNLSTRQYGEGGTYVEFYRQSASESYVDTPAGANKSLHISWLTNDPEPVVLPGTEL